MNNERSEDDSWTCPDCGKRNWPDVGMSFCDCKFGENTMGMFSHEPECTADVGVMGHLGCTNPNCSCKPSSRHENGSYDFGGYTPTRDYAGNINPPSLQTAYVPPDVKLKHRGLVHETEKAKLFYIVFEKTIYEIWIPKRCILKETNKKVTVSNSFYTKSVLKQASQQQA